MQPPPTEDYAPLPIPNVARQQRQPRSLVPHPIDRKNPWTGVVEAVEQRQLGTLRHIVKRPYAIDPTDPWSPEENVTPTWGYGEVVKAEAAASVVVAGGT